MRFICLAALVLLPLNGYAGAIFVDLGTAGSFSVFAGTSATNTGPTFLAGDLGVSPGATITGFPPGTVSGVTHADDATAIQAAADLASAYTFAAAETCPGGNSLSGDLGGLSLAPGVYCFAAAATLTGTLTLDNLGDSNGIYVFQMASSLTTAIGSSVVFDSGQDYNVFWQVGSSATLDGGTSFSGDILADTSITLDAGANIQGSALAINGAVSLDSNSVTTPEPSTAFLLLLIGVPGLLRVRGRKAARA